MKETQKRFDVDEIGNHDASLRGVVGSVMDWAVAFSINLFQGRNLNMG